MGQTHASAVCCNFSVRSKLFTDLPPSASRPGQPAWWPRPSGQVSKPGQQPARQPASPNNQAGQPGKPARAARLSSSSAIPVKQPNLIAQSALSAQMSLPSCVIATNLQWGRRYGQSPFGSLLGWEESKLQYLSFCSLLRGHHFDQLRYQFERRGRHFGNIVFQHGSPGWHLGFPLDHNKQNKPP